MRGRRDDRWLVLPRRPGHRVPPVAPPVDRKVPGTPPCRPGCSVRRDRFRGRTGATPRTLGARRGVPSRPGAVTAYFQRWVRIARPTSDSLIWMNTSRCQSSGFPPRSSGRIERPCISWGTGMPAASSRVGGRSIRLTRPRTWPPPSNPGPVKTVGTRIEASWHDRLYSAFRVLKWQP